MEWSFSNNFWFCLHNPDHDSNWMEWLELRFVLSLMDVMSNLTEAMIGHDTKGQFFQVGPLTFHRRDQTNICEKLKCENWNAVLRCDYE
jgi:hypothetical protein